MKFRLRSLFAVVSIAALLMFVWAKYLSDEQHFIEIGVFLQDWEITNSDPGELSELMQRSLPPESRRDLTVYELRVDGVLIKPGFTSIWFRTQGREWDRQEDLKRLDRVIKAFLDSDPELQIDHFEMEEYTYESDGDSWRKRRIYRKEFDSYPLQ